MYVDIELVYIIIVCGEIKKNLRTDPIFKLKILIKIL